MSRIVGILTIVLVTACGAENWSFDHDAGVVDANGNVVEASASDDDAENVPPSQDSGAHETGASETGPAAEAGPACSADRDCPASSPLCGASGNCIRCRSSSDCQPDSGAPACNTSTGSCVECTLSADCAGDAGLPYCDTSAHVCVHCLSNLDCGFEAICLLTTHTCLKMLF